MTYTPAKLLTFEEFLAQYGDNSRYELIDGELRDMEPTGLHEVVSGSVAGRVYAEILRSKLNWLIPKNCLIQPPAATATALRPECNCPRLSPTQEGTSLATRTRNLQWRKYQTRG
jgi:Uma2 family endonuclease